MKNDSVIKSKSRIGNYMVESSLLGSPDEHNTLCFASATAAIFKMKDLRFTFPQALLWKKLPQE